jgi:DNA-binding HxlR family transcriptional regulator
VRPMSEDTAATPSSEAPAPAADADPIVAAVEAVGDRWSLRIVAVLLDGPLAFGDLERAVPGIVASTLSGRLKQLEAVGVVVAVPYSQRPVRYAYELSAAGRDLAGAVRLLAGWGAARAGCEPPVRHAACGTPAEARWWCPTCERPAQGDEVTELHHL